MPDLALLRTLASRVAARVAAPLPGPIGGMGTYFSAQRRLAEDGAGAPWHRDVDRLLALSDRALARGAVDAALRWFDKALRISYHPSLHQAGRSPLVADPQAVLRPLRAGAVGALLLGEPGPSSPAPQRPAPRERGDEAPRRLLVIAQENWTFARPLIQALRATGRYEVREIDVDRLPGGAFPDRDAILRGRHDLAAHGRRLPTPPELAEAYVWADVAWVEWSHHVLTWITLLDRAPRTLVARLHRFEVFTPFPLLHDHTVIDRMLYVSPPVWAMLRSLAPRYQRVHGVQVGNLLARGTEPLPREDHDPLLLTQVGWIREVKDVLFTLEVLERLRAQDPGYRLQLIGPGLPADPARDTPYQRRVRARLAALPAGAVEQLGVREDVPALLARAGAIVSSSRHEGTHESVMEALAVGVPAVIRDWPDTVPFGGPATLYRPEWVVGDVDAAVARIRALRAPDRYARESADARAYALAHRDPAVVVAGYERALAPEIPAA